MNMDVGSINKPQVKTDPNGNNSLNRSGSMARAKETHKAQIDDDKLKQACADFEGVLLNFMFQAMKKTVPEDGVFGGSHEKAVYESMFYQEISAKFAKERGMGIGDAMYRQLKGKIEGTDEE